MISISKNMLELIVKSCIKKYLQYETEQPNIVLDNN